MFSKVVVAQHSDFERNLELGLRLNTKLREFSKTLSLEEQKALGTIVRLAEFAVENSSIAVFGLENKEIVKKLRRKLVELNCDDSSRAPEQAFLTTPVTLINNPAL